MRNKPIQADQLIPTSSTPPPEAGFYRIDRHTIGVVGNMVFRDPNTQAVSGSVEARLAYTREDIPNKSLYAFGSGNASATGVEATTMGYHAGLSLGFQYSCTAIGAWALESNVTGSDHTAIGCEALQYADGGVGNTAVGKRAARWNSSGTGNTAIGDTALEFNTTGDRNASVGYSSLLNLDGGDDNAALGNSAGRGLTGACSRNVMLGFGAGAAGLQKVDAQNTICIGADSWSTADNQTVIGNNQTVETVLRGNSLKVGEPGSGSNSAGGRYTISGGPSTGSADGGAIAFSTSSPGSAGSSFNPLVERWFFNTNGHFWATTHNTYDIGGDGIYAPRNIYVANQVIGGTLLAGSTGVLGFRSKSQISSPVNGNLRLMNAANTDFGLLQFGLATSAAPALKRSGASLQVRLADDTAYAPISASVVQRAALTFATLPAVASWPGADAYITDCNTSTVGAVAAGGGAIKALVWSDGTNWKVLAA